jgi:hypothetical protein
METCRIDDEAGGSIQSVSDDSASLITFYQPGEVLFGHTRDSPHYSCNIEIGKSYVCESSDQTFPLTQYLQIDFFAMCLVREVYDPIAICLGLAVDLGVGLGSSCFFTRNFSLALPFAVHSRNLLYL